MYEISEQNFLENVKKILENENLELKNDLKNIKTIEDTKKYVKDEKIYNQARLAMLYQFINTEINELKKLDTEIKKSKISGREITLEMIKTIHFLIEIFTAFVNLKISVISDDVKYISSFSLVYEYIVNNFKLLENFSIEMKKYIVSCIDQGEELKIKEIQYDNDMAAFLKPQNMLNLIAIKSRSLMKNVDANNKNNILEKINDLIILWQVVFENM